MITELKATTLSGDVRIVNALRESIQDDTMYLLTFTPNKKSVNGSSNYQVKQTALVPIKASRQMNSYKFQLERGLYDVQIATILDRNFNDARNIPIDPDSVYQYPTPVMVGDPYVVKARKEEAHCYGVDGVRVRISSGEMAFDSETMYYTIKKEKIDRIKYYVPFEGNMEIDFFVQGIRCDELELHLSNPSFIIEWV